MTGVDFHDMKARAPDLDRTREEYAEIGAAIEGAADAAACIEAVRRWNVCRQAVDTWGALVGLHFNQDTRDPDAKRALEERDGMSPKILELDLELMRKLTASPHRAAVESGIGKHAFDLWEALITTYDPAIESEKIQESKLESEYTELIASGRVDYNGETLTLVELGKHNEDPKRDVRHDVSRLRWGWFRDNAAALDRIFGELVALRTSMARKLGFDDFVELAYRRLQRTDYDRTDVERFRAEVREHVVPLATELRRRQAERIGVDRLMSWDEALRDPQGNPKPQGDHDWMVERAREMFDQMGGGLGEFFRLMVDRNLTDLKARKGKGGGGFCTSFPDYGVPFIFANFNGTKGDVEVFTHEMGHAFQGYCSRDNFPLDYLWPTAEACEIHSMGLEFLTWPHMGKFFGEDDADRFRGIHLEESLLFLPYGVAIDHFQHLVYENPDATPAERNAFWQEMERTYLPWRDYGDLERPAAGGFWQCQLHVYRYPFYYIDYTLAQTCALQIWKRSEADFAEAMEAYVALCRRGGEAPFQELVRGADLTSPFQSGCLADVVDHARAILGV